MPKKAAWPSTDSERRDRNRVVDLVNRVGETQLLFTVYDLRSAMETVPRLQLEQSGQLSRHVHALDEGLITPVSQRLAFGAAQGEGRPSKARHQWVLTRRLGEYETSVPELDDLERVYHALWVAMAALESTEVPTRVVTDVLRNLEDLALRSARNTLNHLMTLYNRNQRLVDKVKREGTRWSMWRPIGDEPEHPHFDRWVAAYRALGTRGEPVRGSGHATLSAMAHELVVLALRAKRSSHWPAGHSVQITDIRAVAGADPRARQLARMIRERGRSLGAVIGDVTKERIAGRARVERRVIKIASLAGQGTYYDVPGEPGFERRRLVVSYRALQAELSDTHSISWRWSMPRRTSCIGPGGTMRSAHSVRCGGFWSTARWSPPSGWLWSWRTGASFCPRECATRCRSTVVSSIAFGPAMRRPRMQRRRRRCWWETWVCRWTQSWLRIARS